MGFLFRTAFWLALAIFILPPQARLGGEDTADFGQIDVGTTLSELGASAWDLGSRVANTCAINPKLCAAGQDLWDKSVTTATGLIDSAEKHWTDERERPRRYA